MKIGDISLWISNRFPICQFKINFNIFIKTKAKCYLQRGALTPIGAGRPKFKPFILTYHPFGPNLRKCLREAFPLMSSGKKLKQIYLTPPSVMYNQPEADTR